MIQIPIRFELKKLNSMMIMLFLLLMSHSISAQDEEDECDQPAKKAVKLFDNAVKYNLKGQEAYESLLKAVEIDENYAAAYSALAYINNQEAIRGMRMATVAAMNGVKRAESRAIKYWKLTIEKCPSYRDYEAYFLIGKLHYERGEKEEAIGYLSTYLANNSENTTDVKQAAAWLNESKVLKKFEDRKKLIRDSLLKNPVPFNPQKVAGASSKNDEYLPILSPDNQFLFFTRREWVDTRSVRGKEERERFIKSKNNYNRTFTAGNAMPLPFNQGDYQGGVTVSVDNKLILVTLVKLVPRKNGVLYSNGDIYYSEFDGKNWSALKSVGNNINGNDTWEGQPSISADNKTLYFASAREPDGVNNFGGMDIYRSEKQPDGSWGNPINLGPKINTSGDEKTPFLHSDSYTLYFSSNELPGIGGFDIFHVKMDADGNVGAPKNIGYPINTEDDEHGFVVSTNGKYGYFSSNLESDNLDIYSFELPEEARPEKVAFVRGQIISEGNATEGLEITLKNTETSKEVSAVIDKNTGEYVGVIAVADGEDAIMTAKKEGYAFTSQYISSTENVVGKPMEVEMEVKKIAVGETYRINNVNFATNSFALTNQVKTILDEFIDFLNTNPTVKVKIQGHTDNVGNAQKNLNLSDNRAKSVFNYIVEKGIDAGRLSYEGFGQNQPIATNETAEGRAENRRTEFLILSK